jgi:trehalose 6-phosphate phosphatase
MTTESTVPLAGNPLFFLDYDGTLAPIVDDPMAAFPHPRAVDLLFALRDAYPVFIVTGRHLADLARLLKEPRLPAIGLHGTQMGDNAGSYQDQMPTHVRQSLGALRGTVPEMEGLVVEPKGPAFAVHYRQAPDHDAARGVLRKWLVEMPDSLTAIWGKAVVELRPRNISKGTAVQRIAADMPDRTPVYLGDDVTDEDAFKALPEPAITVRIGPGETVARHRLAGPDEVMDYLQRYL